MTLAQNCEQSQVMSLYYDSTFFYGRNFDASVPVYPSANYNNHVINFNQMESCSKLHDDFIRFPAYDYTYNDHYNSKMLPSAKKRKYSNGSWGKSENRYQPSTVSHKNSSGIGNLTTSFSSTCNDIRTTVNTHLGVAAPIKLNKNVRCSASCKRDRAMFEEENEVIFMSRDEIEKCSPSRKDGIDAIRETHLRYSYCAFLQNLGVRLDVPQPTIATAMVLCHRFFIRRSHACHDRFVIATAALFLAAKSEETARPLNDVLLISSEILHSRDFLSLSYILPADWLEQYKERVLEAEQLILTTLNFELNVQHPYAPLTSTLEKLGLAQTMLVNLALNLVSQGLRSSLWLQFEPQQIAAGAAYLAAKFLNMDFASCHNVWKEFHTSPSVLKDIAQQLMELL